MWEVVGARQLLWDLISPIHMLCKNIGLIWEHFEKMVQPTKHILFSYISKIIIFCVKTKSICIPKVPSNIVCVKTKLFVCCLVKMDMETIYVPMSNNCVIFFKVLGEKSERLLFYLWVCTAFNNLLKLQNNFWG